MSLPISKVIQYLETLAPPSLAESWDNVGLLLGDGQRSIDSLMTCLTLTPDVAAEAVQKHAGLVVTHHPILFQAVKRLTSDTPEGRMLLELICAGVAVYSPHTAFDNGDGGINRWMAEELGLKDIAPLRSLAEKPFAGSGRLGEFDSPLSWEEFQKHVAAKLRLKDFQVVAAGRDSIRKVGIACGAAGEFLTDAHRQGCDAFLTGETRFHTCLEAETLGVSMVLLGHYQSERPALEMLARRLGEQFPALKVWASETERDPLIWVSAKSL